MKTLLARIRYAFQKYFCNQIPWKYHRCVIFPHPIGIVIGSDAYIAKNVVVYQNVTIGGRSFNSNGPSDYPRIHENVVIYPGAVIAGGITVGANSIVGPNAVVTKDVPPNSLVVGINDIKIKADRDVYTKS